MQILLSRFIAMRKFPFWNRPNHFAHCNYMLAVLVLILIPQLLDMFKPLIDGATCLRIIATACLLMLYKNLNFIIC